MLAPDQSNQYLLIETRLSNTRTDLDEILEHLHQDLMAWAPSLGMRTVAGRLVEVAITEMQIVLQLTDGKWMPDDDAKQIIGDCHSLDNLKHYLQEIRNATLVYLASLSEADLTEGVKVRTMGLPTIPRAEVFRTIAQHEAYHVGQLTSYLWMRGDNPYHW